MRTVVISPEIMYWILLAIVSCGLCHVTLSEDQGPKDGETRSRRMAECRNFPDATRVTAYVNGRECHLAVAGTGRQLCYQAWSLTRQCCERCLAMRNDQQPNCQYGDRGICRNLRPRDCTLAQNRDVCCETCARLDTGDAGCPYGDQSPDCYGMRAAGCYDGRIRNACCATCPRLQTGIRGCEYGNRMSDQYCRSEIQFFGRGACNRQQLAQNCCQSCQNQW